MNKIIFALALSTLFFGACSLSNPSTVSGNTKDYETANFKISYPLEWEVIDQDKFSSSVSEDIVVAFRSNIKNESFTTNLNIAVNILDKELIAKDIGLSTLSLASKKLVSFVEIANKEVSINTASGKTIGYYLEYEGKNSPKDPLVRFKQIFVADGGVIYAITCAHLPTEDESIVNMADTMLNSFTLK